MKTGRREEAYKMMKKFFGQYKPRAGGIEDNNGKMLWEQKDIVKRWKEYLEIFMREKLLMKSNQTKKKNMKRIQS
jgi:hypothetical protein